MNNVIKHRGYTGSIEVNHQDGVFHGRLLYVNAMISYEGETYADLKQAFIDAVEDYLAFCREKGISPEKAFSGSFNIRTGPERHRKAVMTKADNESLNEFVSIAIDHEIERRLGHH